MTKTSRTPERAELAAAIKAKEAAADALRQADDALRLFDERFSETRSAYYEADQNLGEVRQKFKEQMAHHGGSESAVAAYYVQQSWPAPREEIASAERAYVIAEENYKLGKDGRWAVQGARDAAAAAHDKAVRKAEEAAGEVKRTRLDDVLKEAEAAKTRWFAARSIVAHLGRDLPGVTYDTHTTNDPVADRIKHLLGDLSSSYAAIETAAVAPWKAAREALLRDPDAELPT